MNIYFFSNSSILYLFVCLVILFFYDSINRYYNLLASTYCFIVLDLIYFLLSFFITNGFWYYSILTLYLLTVYFINKIGGNCSYFIFGILIVLFQSEFWELPLHIYWNSLNLGIFLMFSYIVYTMYILKLNYIGFIKWLILFIIPYSAMVEFLYPMDLFRNNYIISDFFFRIICSLSFISFIYINKKIYKIKES